MPNTESWYRFLAQALHRRLFGLLVAAYALAAVRQWAPQLG
jgi:hypothetical protein